MLALYKNLRNNTAPKIIKKFGQKCSVRTPSQCGYLVNDCDKPKISTVGGASWCVVDNGKSYKDSESPFALRDGESLIIMTAAVKPEKGGEIDANSRTFRILKVTEVNPADSVIVYLVLGSDQSIAQTQLHVADLTLEVQILSRSIRGDHPDSSTQENTAFELLECCMMACKTSSSVAAVGTVNVKTTKETHTFYARAEDIGGIEFDINEHVLEFNGVVYRILSIENIDGQYKTVVFHCVERGTTTQGFA